MVIFGLEKAFTTPAVPNRNAEVLQTRTSVLVASTSG